MPGGSCCAANITPALRERLSGVPLTSVSAETMFARVKRRADRGGVARHDTRMGAVLCERDGTVAWARAAAHTQGLWDLSRRRWRAGSGKRKMRDELFLKGEAKAPERAAKLAKKRKGRSAKAAQLERFKTLALVEMYKALKSMGNDALSDQLKVYKLIEKKTGFKTTGTGPEMRRLLQSLIFEKFGAAANDLDDGDSGLDGRAVNDGQRRQRKVEGSGGKGGRKGGKGGREKKVVELHGWEWEETEEFEIEALIGKMVAEDGVEVPGRRNVKAGTLLYKVLWKGFPPDIATWEEEDQIPCGEQDFVAEYEAGLDEEEAQAGEGAEESDDESDAESDGEPMEA